MAKSHSWTWTSLSSADGDSITYENTLAGCSRVLFQVQCLGEVGATPELYILQNALTDANNQPPSGGYYFLVTADTLLPNTITNYYFNVAGLKWLTLTMSSQSGSSQFIITTTAQELETYPAR